MNMKDLKRVISIILVVTMMFSLTACGDKGEKTEKTENIKDVASIDDPIIGMWNAVIVALPGDVMVITDMYQKGISLELISNGNYILIWDGAKNKGKWSFSDGEIILERNDGDFVGTIENDILKLFNVLDLDMDLTFEKEGSLAVGSIDENILIEVGLKEVLSEVQQWWDGDWYGYWETHSETEYYKDFQGGRWETFGVINMQVDDTGSIYLWDSEDDFAMANITVNEYGGSGFMGAALSESGHLWFGEEIGHADWIIDPSLYGYENYMVIDGRYEDEFGEGFNYTVYLRPWGESWDENAEDERPPFYDIWYLSAYQAATMWEAIEDRSGHIHSEIGDIIIEQEPEDTEVEVVSDPEPTEAITGETVEAILQLESGLKVSATLPPGWCSDSNWQSVTLYNVPTLNDAYSNSPKIKIVNNETLEKFDFYIADFENLKTIENRTISGIDMKGRTYKNVGMDWIEYLGMTDSGYAVSIQISKIDINSVEGKAVLDSIKLE